MSEETEPTYVPPAFDPPALDPAWIEARLALHRSYEEHAGLADSSRLGYLNQEQQQWTEDEIVDRWRVAAHATDRRRDAINHVYIHVPFCKSICSFCNYDRLRPSSASLLEQYTERIFRSLHAIGPVVKPMRWHTLYMGGGTASILPPNQLKQILTAIDETLRWHPNSTRFFEFDPAVFNTDKLDVLLEHRFEHFSFGIQTLDSKVNQAHNRGPQSRDIIHRRFGELRGAGIHNISCDFLLGLAGTTPAQILEEIEEILSLQPRWIDLYFITPTKEYIDAHFAGSYEAFWAHIKPFHDIVPAAAREIAAKHGFRLRRGHGHNIVIFRQMGAHERQKHKSNGIFSYTQLVDQQRRPLHLLGLGTSARSLIFGQCAIECRNPDDLGQPEAPHYYVGHEYGMEGEVRLFLSHMLRDNDVIDRALFARIFGMDIVEIMPRAVAKWLADGKVTLTDTEFRLQSEERRERMRTLLWTVPDEVLVFEQQRHERNLAAQARSREHQAQHGGAAPSGTPQARA